MSTHIPRQRIAVVATVEFAVTAFLRQHLAALSQRYEVTVFTTTQDPAALASLLAPTQVEPLEIAREISPVRDARALFALWRQLRAKQFDAVLSLTPKGGLLAMLAGWLAGVPTRVHIFTGQVWATRTGWGRRLLKAADRLLAWAATDLLADSGSQKDFLIDERVVRPSHIQVLAAGSISGVDTARFRPDPAARTQVRAEWDIPPHGALVLFLGRLTRDKGVLDLAHAFASLAADSPDAHLAFVGPDEGGLRDAILKVCDAARARVHFAGYTRTPERYLAAAEVFCLPSYREGFGSVVIEAGAAGLPVVASRIYGLTDAVEEGQTGLLHTPGDAERIADCLRRLLAAPEERRRLGEAGRSRAVEQFSAERVTGAFVAYVDERLNGAAALMAKGNARAA